MRGNYTIYSFNSLDDLKTFFKSFNVSSDSDSDDIQIPENIKFIYKVPTKSFEYDVVYRSEDDGVYVSIKNKLTKITNNMCKNYVRALMFFIGDFNTVTFNTTREFIDYIKNNTDENGHFPYRVTNLLSDGFEYTVQINDSDDPEVWVPMYFTDTTIKNLTSYEEVNENIDSDSDNE